MSGHMGLVGFKPADEKWQKMKAAWDACVAGDIDIPNDVLEFFGHEEPDPAGVKVALVGYANMHESVSEVQEDMTDGYGAIKKLEMFSSDNKAGEDAGKGTEG